MTDPRHSNDSRPPAESAASHAPGDPERVVNPEAAYGGADAVEKTSYGVGEATDPAGRAAGATAHPPSGSGPNYLAWGIGAVAGLVAIFYLLSLIA